MTRPDLRAAVSTFGASAKAKLSNASATGEPEDQLRAPLEVLLADLAELSGLPRDQVTAVGESSLADLKTRPDYAVTVRGALVGFIEVKAPGKGAEPSRFRDAHDRAQWDKLRSLPNLLYTDGNEFSLWRNGERAGEVVKLIGDVETAGAKLDAPPALTALITDFLQWAPVSPRSVKQLAEVSARLCRLLRDEVLEQMLQGSRALTSLASDWRRLLFPEASDAQFADGYAQAVTFGLLVARAREIRLGDGLDRAAKSLGRTNSLIGAALRLLTDDAENQATLQTSLGTLVRVLDAVHWPTISKGRPDAWLYFYEDFLQVYDNRLRKQTGSYYTPPEVVDAMVRLVDEALRLPGAFDLPGGLAAPEVTVVDPAVGTGTFLLGVMRQLAARYARDEGEGAVPAAVEGAMDRLIAFELQLGPFAVAQLRVLAECAAMLGAAPSRLPRMFVTDTLGNPYAEQESLGSQLEPIAESRRRANAIKRDERIRVVLGNPPYKEKAKGRGGWVESGGANVAAPLDDWMPPRDWGVGAHAKHLRNLYVYFWRWATWKVFDAHPGDDTGIVCFITVAGFLDGDGFQRMRDYLRRRADAIWVIDCSPEGHQPEVSTRIFEGVQQPVCIVLAARSPRSEAGTPARVRFRALPDGRRDEKFDALRALSLTDEGWQDCPTDWRAPFLPASTGAWPTYPALEDYFVYDGSGVMPGRTWVIAPDVESLRRRWQALIDAPLERKEALFHPHVLKDGLGDRHVHKRLSKGLPGFAAPTTTIAAERGGLLTPVRYGFRSFDRQWIIPDNRVINRPNPALWVAHSPQQLFATAPTDQSATVGPALTFSAGIPDMHHYNGRGGRVFPLWRDRESQEPNVPQSLLAALGQHFGRDVSAEDVIAYVAALAAHPAYTARFQKDLATPGLRIPLTADASCFADAVALGREVIWLHTFGERFADAAAGRPPGPPRMPDGTGPHVPRGGAIPQSPEAMPDTIDHDAATRRLHVGSGHVDGVDPRVWAYEVSGKQVLRQWFSYRRKSRERPLMGDRRPPSKLGEIQPDHWLAEYTSELLNVLHVLGRLVDLEPAQAVLLERVCAGRLLSVDALRDAGALDATPGSFGATREPDMSGQQSLLLDA